MNLDFIKKNKKTAAAVAAAIVLGSGAGIYFSTGESDAEIDWSSITLDVPELDVPTLDIPKFDIPTITIDSVDIRLNPPSIIKYDENGFPYIEVEADKPQRNVPILSVQSTVKSTTDAPAIVVPAITVANTDTPSMSAASTNAPSQQSTPSTDAPSTDEPKLDATQTATPALAANTTTPATSETSNADSIKIADDTKVQTIVANDEKLNAPTTLAQKPNAYLANQTTQMAASSNAKQPIPGVDKQSYSTYSAGTYNSGALFMKSNGKNTRRIMLMPAATFKLNIDSISFDNVSIDELTANGIKFDSMALPYLASLIINDNIVLSKEDMNNWIAFRKTIKNTFLDKRMVEYDNSLTFENTYIKEWLGIYGQYEKTEPIQYVPVSKFRMITEVRPILTTAHKEKLDTNLEFYKANGYDSVLVTFYPEDNVISVVNTIKYIKANHKLKVWLAYSGEESLATTVFCDPKLYKKVLTEAAPFLDGYLNSWRRTSAHLWEQDPQFKTFTNSILRSINPNIPIVGELYFGNYWQKEGEGNTGFVENRNENESGVCIMNFGYSNINIKYLVKGIIKPYIRNTPLIGCVVGSKGYYASRSKNGLDAEQNFKVKQGIEQDFFNAGFIGTITFQDDGSSTTTNNLCETLYNEVTGK